MQCCECATREYPPEMQVSRELEAGVDVLLHLGEDAGHKLGEWEPPREGSLNQSHKYT